MTGFEDPYWPRASTWLGRTAGEPRFAVLGVPLNISITPGRCDLAPGAIRAVLRRYSTWDYQGMRDVADLAAADRGDLADPNPEAIAAHVAEAAGSVLAILGGDNGLTRPAFQGMAVGRGLRLADCGLITVDAHLDLRSLDLGAINGNPVRGLLADGLPGENIVQIGPQDFTNSAVYAQVAAEAGIRVVPRHRVRDLAVTFAEELERLAGRVGAVYVDLDLDALDRAYAPGCPGARPGGFTPADMFAVARIAGAHPQVEVVDLVEFDPTADVADTTALVAAAVLLHFAAGIASR